MPKTNFTRFAWGVLTLNIFVIIWGAYVRATGSGAGCGSHWPTCNGEVIPRDPSIQTMIEYSHRTTSGLALLAVTALLVVARRLFPAGHHVRRGAAASMVLILTEAAIGAGLVLFGLVEDNDSVARAFSMALHLTNTFLLLAALTVTAYWSTAETFPRRWTSPLKSARLFWFAVGATLLIGISGAVAALGDTLFPATSLAEGFAQDFDASSHLFIKLRTLHPAIAVAGSLLLLSLVSTVRREKIGPTGRAWATRLNLLVIVQLAAGGLNIILLAPVWMQLVHLAIADLLWIALVLTGSEILADPRSTSDVR